MGMRLRISAAACALLIGTACSTSALAVAVATTTTYNFTGLCSDCRGIVTAELVLQNYQLATPITSSNFVSFHYDGSNLFAAFTILASDATYLSGFINNGSATGERVSVYARNGLFFNSSSDGTWDLGRLSSADQGTIGVYRTGMTAVGGSVPEPASWAMMVGGFGMIGAAMRRRPVGSATPLRG